MRPNADIDDRLSRLAPPSRCPRNFGSLGDSRYNIDLLDNLLRRTSPTPPPRRLRRQFLHRRWRQRLPFSQNWERGPGGEGLSPSPPSPASTRSWPYLRWRSFSNRLRRNRLRSRLGWCLLRISLRTPPPAPTSL